VAAAGVAAASAPAAVNAARPAAATARRARAMPRNASPQRPMGPMVTSATMTFPSDGVPMKPSHALAVHRVAIRRIVASHRARNARVFGSVLRGEDRDGSNLDLLIDPTSETTLMDIGAIRHELIELLGMPVDVVTPKGLPERYRSQVLAQAQPL